MTKLEKKPTIDEINNYAYSLAKADGKAVGQIIDLIYWPTWVTPPEFSDSMRETVRIHGDYVKNLKERAKAALAGETEAIKPVKRTQSPNLKKVETRRTLAPPGEYELQEPPVVSPCRPERRILLLRAPPLFDNRIVITAA